MDKFPFCFERLLGKLHASYFRLNFQLIFSSTINIQEYNIEMAFGNYLHNIDMIFRRFRPNSSGYFFSSPELLTFLS